MRWGFLFVNFVYSVFFKSVISVILVILCCFSDMVCFCTCVGRVSWCLSAFVLPLGTLQTSPSVCHFSPCCVGSVLCPWLYAGCRLHQKEIWNTGGRELRTSLSLGPQNNQLPSLNLSNYSHVCFRRTVQGGLFCWPTFLLLLTSKNIIILSPFVKPMLVLESCSKLLVGLLSVFEDVPTCSVPVPV